MLGQLVPCGGGKPIPLARPRLIVGRAVDCDVRIDAATISSRHCSLDWRDERWFATDLGSRNGIKIDGIRRMAGELRPGGILSIAQLRYEVDYVQNVKESPAADRSPEAAPSAAPAAHGAQLGELIPCGGGAPIPLPGPKLIVGRSPACDVVLANSTVSSKHCELEFKEGFWHVRDLGSLNGVRVNGTNCQTKYLRPGDIVGIATLRFELAFQPSADEPPPDENPFALSLLEKARLTLDSAVGRGGGATPAGSGEDRRRMTIEDDV